MVFSKYCFLLLKRRPPRDMSSQGTTSSGIPGRRMHALNFTLVRACLRRSSGRDVAGAAAGGEDGSGCGLGSGGDHAWDAGRPGAKTGWASGGSASATDGVAIGDFTGTGAGDAEGSPVASFQTVEDPQRLQ